MNTKTQEVVEVENKMIEKEKKVRKTEKDEEDDEDCSSEADPCAHFQSNNLTG